MVARTVVSGGQFENPREEKPAARSSWASESEHELVDFFELARKGAGHKGRSVSWMLPTHGPGRSVGLKGTVPVTGALKLAPIILYAGAGGGCSRVVGKGIWVNPNTT